MGRWLYGEPVPTGGKRQGRAQYRFKLGAAYEVGPPWAGWVLTVPSTFVFDNSAPWWIAWALPMRAMRRATGLHDFARQDPAFNLWFGNLLFLDASRADGIREPWLTLTWWGVRTNRNR